MTDDRLRAAVRDVMAHQWSHRRDAMQALTDLVDAAEAGACEIDSLRDVLAELVRIYVREGAAVTPAVEIGAAWDAAVALQRM